MKGALVGPITLCIVGDQFARLKKGDRFFYDLGGQQGEAAFTPSQLTEVGKPNLGLNIHVQAFLKFWNFARTSSTLKIQILVVTYRGGILGRNWDKNLKTVATCFSQSPPPADFTPPCGILSLTFLQQQLKLQYVFVYLRK